MKELDYVRKKLTPNNENWMWKDGMHLSDRREEIRKLVKEKTGRKMQAKATPLREGVVVIDKKTTMADLQRLAEALRNRFGFETIHISIHRDEGHWVTADGRDAGLKPDDQPTAQQMANGVTWKPNLHAHMVFDWYNHKTGKSVKTTKQDARDMQTICAHVLGMERGVASDKIHMDGQSYKIAEKQKELNETKREVEAAKEEKRTIKAETEQLNVSKARKEAAIEAAHEAVEGVKSLFGASDRDKQIKSLTEQVNALQDENKQLRNSVEEEKQKAVEDTRKVLNAELTKVRQQIPSLQNSRDTARRERDEARKTADVFRGLLASVWEGLSDAIKAMLELAFDDRRRNFTRTEVAAIDNALGTDNDTGTRRALGRELIRMAKEECPDRIYEGRIDTQRQDIEAIANREYQERSQGMGIKL